MSTDDQAEQPDRAMAQRRRPELPSQRALRELRELISTLSEDEQVPPVRQFAKDIGVSPEVARKAYVQLEREGLIFSMARWATFRSSRPMPDDDAGEQ